MKVLLCAAVVSLCLAGQALAAYDLQITEIWPGNTSSDNLTDDWFEVTNFGDLPWVAATDGNLFYDDNSFDSSTADLMSGVPSIAPGESVVFVDGGALGGAVWTSVWTSVVSPLPQVGTYEGAGLGQGGDAIGLWITTGLPTGTPDVTGSYPDGNASGGGSYDLVLGTFSTVGNASGAVATDVLNADSEAAIASPGSVATVPEPATFALLGMSLVVFAAKRR